MIAQTVTWPRCAPSASKVNIIAEVYLISEGYCILTKIASTFTINYKTAVIISTATVKSLTQKPLPPIGNSYRPLSKLTTTVQLWRREPPFMRHIWRSQYPSGPAQLRGIRTVRRPGALYRINERRRLPLLPPLGQWVPVSVLGSRIAQSLFGSRSVSRLGRVGSEYPITDRTNQFRYEPLPHFTITATSARGPSPRWRTRQM
jgi:hypothetical protein